MVWVCVPWNNAGDCIPPRKTHCSHYCISILIWCKMYCDITYCITICMCSGFGIQYSYSVSCTVYCNTIFLCSVLVGREYNIHMSAPQWGGRTLHSTLHCSPHYCQCHHHHHFCCQCQHHFTWHPNVIFVSFHVLIYEISQILEPWISDEANASWAQPHLARALIFFCC